VAAGSASGAGELTEPAAPGARPEAGLGGPAPGAEDWRCDAIVQSAGAKLARCRGRSSLGQVLSSHGVRWSTAAGDSKRAGGAGWILRGRQGRERGNGEIASRLASPEFASGRGSIARRIASRAFVEPVRTTFFLSSLFFNDGK
jgi:hypothetical protein